jgi:hypothetical protein
MHVYVRIRPQWSFVHVRREAMALARELDRAMSDRTVLLWGVATGIAAIVSAASGFYLLHMIAAPDWVTSIPRWVDAVVTGLVVGTGTKPLHDLINRAQDATKPKTTS